VERQEPAKPVWVKPELTPWCLLQCHLAHSEHIAAVVETAKSYDSYLALGGDICAQCREGRAGT